MAKLAVLRPWLQQACALAFQAALFQPEQKKAKLGKCSEPYEAVGQQEKKGHEDTAALVLRDVKDVTRFASGFS